MPAMSDNIFFFPVSQEPHLVKCSRNLLPNLSSAASIAKFVHFFRQSVNLTKTIIFLLDYQIVQLKPVEEYDQLIPSTELRVLVASCVEHNLER